MHSPSEESALVMDRFCGREIYPLKDARWNLIEDKELGFWSFYVFVEAGEGTKLHEDTQELNGAPAWELSFPREKWSLADLRPGMILKLPRGYDEERELYLGNFFYRETQETDENRLKILAVDGDRLLLRIEGLTDDVNLYDGSKPRSKLIVETWFTKDETLLPLVN